MESIAAIVIDCERAAPLARFWAVALGWRVRPYDDAEIARLRSIGRDPETDPSVAVDSPDGTMTLFCVEVPEGKPDEPRTDLRVPRGLAGGYALSEPVPDGPAADRCRDCFRLVFGRVVACGAEVFDLESGDVLRTPVHHVRPQHCAGAELAGEQQLRHLGARGQPGVVSLDSGPTSAG